MNWYECSHTRTLYQCGDRDLFQQGYIYALGLYYPRFLKEHYESPWSRAVLRAKSKNMAAIMNFGRIAAACLEESFTDFKPYVITHVPADRSVERYLFENLEHCTTQLLAEAIYTNLDSRQVTLANVVLQVREREKKQRHCKTVAERMRNVRGHYRVNKPDSIQGRNVLLVDDVVTTGATMRECMAALLEAGARDVTGIALAGTVSIKAMNLVPA